MGLEKMKLQSLSRLIQPVIFFGHPPPFVLLKLLVFRDGLSVCQLKFSFKQVNKKYEKFDNYHVNVNVKKKCCCGSKNVAKTKNKSVRPERLKRH